MGRKADGDDQEAKTRVTIAIRNAGRDRVAKEQREREAAEAAKAGPPIAINRDIA